MQSYYNQYTNDLQAIILPSMYHQLVYDRYANDEYIIDDRRLIDWYINGIQSIILQSTCNCITIGLRTIYKQLYYDPYTIDWYMIDIQTIIYEQLIYHWQL